VRKDILRCMPVNRLFSILIILFLICGNAWGACPDPVGSVYTPADNTVAKVQECVDAAIAAGDGKTVQLVSGDNQTWASGVSATVSANLIVQGVDITNPVITSNTTGALFTFDVATGKTFELASFKAVGNDSAQANGLVDVTGESQSIKIHHLALDMSASTSGRAMKIGDYNDDVHISGVIYGCTITGSTVGGTIQGITVYGPLAAVNDWQGTPKLGTDFMDYGGMFIENNTFNYTIESDQAVDTSQNARFVFRYNTVVNTSVGMHGYDSGCASTHVFEIYNNDFSTTGMSPSRAVNIRGGTGVIFNNTYDSHYPTTFTLTYIRSCDKYPPAYCAGSSPSTENICPTAGTDGLSDASGYPCYMQPGATGTNGITNWPIIEWNNTHNSVANSMSFANNTSFTGAACDAYQTTDGNPTTYDMDDHVKQGRDWVAHDTCALGSLQGEATEDFCALWWDRTNSKGLQNGSAYTRYTCPHPLVDTGGLYECDTTVAGASGTLGTGYWKYRGGTGGSGHSFTGGATHNVTSGSTITWQ